MRRGQMLSRGARLLTLIALGTTLTGCGMLGSFTNPDISRGSRIGIRPDDPVINVLPADTCSELKNYVAYAVNLKEAYRTRATQNRMWLYVAGIVGLGVAAASGGLGIAGAAAGTIALLSVSGGFSAGAFATINNSELANVYTVAANDIGTALANTQARIARCSRSREECSAELAYLSNRVTSARNTLETARTDSAAGALTRATAAKRLLDEEIAKVLEAEKTAREAAEKKAAAATAQADAAAKKTQAEVDKQAAKDAMDKKTEADKKAAQSAQGAAEAQPKGADGQKPATADADAKKVQAEVDKQAAKDATDKKTEADKKAAQSAQDAAEAQHKAAAAEKSAKDADAKAKADADALAAATAPVSPACLSPTGKAMLDGKILSFTPAAVLFEKDKANPEKNKANPEKNKAKYVDAVVTGVDLREISNANLSIEIGGQTVSVTEKVQMSVGDPYKWTVRFVPPEKRPKDAEFVYTPSLLYAKEILATVREQDPEVTLTYPKP